MVVVTQAKNWRRIPSHTYKPSLSWLTFYKGTDIVTCRWKCFSRCVASYVFVPPTVFTGVVCPCLPDGNKLRQLFTNSLSSSPFSPLLQDRSLKFKQYATKLNVSHMFQMPQKSPPSPYLTQKGVEEKAGGTRHCFHFNGRSHAWLSRGFTKKLGVLAPGQSPDVYLKEKPRGGFYRRQVIDFPEWVSIKLNHWSWLQNSRSSSAFVRNPCCIHSFSHKTFTRL